MKTFSISSVKGGVAKSVTAISMAYLLSEEYRVLLVDSDPQNAMTSHFVEELTSIKDKTVRQILKGEKEVGDCLIRISDTFHFLPSEIELANIERELNASANLWFLMYKALKKIENDYDFCIIDTTQSLHFTTNISIIASDVVIIPTQCEKWAIRAIQATVEEIARRKTDQELIGKSIESIVILPTFYEENRAIKKVFLDLIKEKFSEYITKTVIHTATEISKTFAIAQEFLTKGSRAYDEYKRFLSELKEKGIL